MCAEGCTRYLELPVGPPLGVDARFGRTPRWPSASVPIPPGSSLLMFTDGLLDAHSQGGPDLGITELLSAVEVSSTDGSPAAAWIEALVGAAPNESVDDLAVVVLTTRPPEPGR
jgi:hypothetical protein